MANRNRGRGGRSRKRRPAPAKAGGKRQEEQLTADGSGGADAAEIAGGVVRTARQPGPASTSRSPPEERRGRASGRARGVPPSAVRAAARPAPVGGIQCRWVSARRRHGIRCRCRSCCPGRSDRRRDRPDPPEPWRDLAWRAGAVRGDRGGVDRHGRGDPARASERVPLAYPAADVAAVARVPLGDDPHRELAHDGAEAAERRVADCRCGYRHGPVQAAACAFLDARRERVFAGRR